MTLHDERRLGVLPIQQFHILNFFLPFLRVKLLAVSGSRMELGDPAVAAGWLHDEGGEVMGGLHTWARSNF